jgi:hypothetical protein
LFIDDALELEFLREDVAAFVAQALFGALKSGSLRNFRFVFRESAFGFIELTFGGGELAEEGRDEENVEDDENDQADDDKDAAFLRAEIELIEWIGHGTSWRLSSHEKAQLSTPAAPPVEVGGETDLKSGRPETV